MTTDNAENPQTQMWKRADAVMKRVGLWSGAILSAGALLVLVVTFLAPWLTLVVPIAWIAGAVWLIVKMRGAKMGTPPLIDPAVALCSVGGAAALFACSMLAGTLSRMARADIELTRIVGGVVQILEGEGSPKIEFPLDNGNFWWVAMSLHGLMLAAWSLVFGLSLHQAIWEPWAIYFDEKRKAIEGEKTALATKKEGHDGGVTGS